MTMTDDETKVPARAETSEEHELTVRAIAKMQDKSVPATTAEATVIDLASIVNIEAVYGRALLDEVAAVGADLAARKDDLRAFMVRVTGAVRAATAAEDRVVDLDGSKGAPDELYRVLQVMSGLDALSNLAMQVGLQESIFEAAEPGPNPMPGQFVPGMFGQ